MQHLDVPEYLSVDTRLGEDSTKRSLSASTGFAGKRKFHAHF